MEKNIITISREFGSGGRSIGRLVAQKLGIPFYDKELVNQIALESGFAPKFVEDHGEHSPGTSLFSYAFAPQGVPGVMNGLSTADFLWNIQCNVILQLAEKGPCVIVGRCSDYILGEGPACIKVFIHADMASRIDRCVAEYHIPSDNMESRIIQMDRGRANYYNYYTGHTWGDMRRYDLTLNSSTSGIAGAVELICALVRSRAAVDAQQS